VYDVRRGDVVSLNNMVLLKSDAGEVLELRSLPIPAYELGEVVGYNVNSLDNSTMIEAEVIGYYIHVYPHGISDDGEMEYSYDITYELSNDGMIDEDDIEYSYVAEDV